MEAPSYMLFEHATGYSLFRLKEFEEIGQSLPQVEAAASDISRFTQCCKPLAFHWFTSAEAALENCNAVSEGILHDDLVNFLETHVPREKKAKVKLGVGESKLVAAISERFPFIQCSMGGVVQEVHRGIRQHFDKLADVKEHMSFSKAQLGLGHSYSRSKVKFDVNRVDNMIIQAIALLDQLDKDINTFSMRIREWYSYHFPELYRIVPDQYMYCRCAQAIGNRKQPPEDLEKTLAELTLSEEKAEEILEAMRSSAGIDDISDMDMANIARFTERVVSLGEYRKNLQGYLKERMHSVAPNLSELVGDTVGARLISHAGSLTSLAKYPASTVQILGAEKALFRALKTRGNTPKYGLLFHSTFIGRAGARNKGRISRFLANKCTVASRIDAFAEEPVGTFGEFLRQQVEDRLKYYETGAVPKKNMEVMREATEAASGEIEKAKKRRKKEAKKAKKRKASEAHDTSQDVSMNGEEEQVEEPPKKKKKKKPKQEEQEQEEAEEPQTPAVESPKKGKKKRKSEVLEEPVEEEPATEEPVKKSKKKKKAKQEPEPEPEEEEQEEEQEETPKPKKKKKKAKQTA